MEEMIHSSSNMMKSKQSKDEADESPSRESQLQQWITNRYMGQKSWFITKLFGFQYFIILRRYFFGVDDKNVLVTRPSYQPMYTNQYLWTRMRKKRKTFNLYKQIIYSQKASLIVIIVFSIFIGICALFGAFYQRFLFLQLQDEQKIAHGQHIDHPFETSGWVFFSIIMGTTVLRFFAFNYAQGLANEVSRNVRIHLQNCYFRVLMRVNTKHERTNEGFLINNFYVSINVVSEVVKLLPYIILSVVIVAGISAFVISIVGSVGTIVFGFIGIILMIHFGIVRYMLHLHHKYVRHSDRRTTLTRMNGTFMLRLTFNKLITPFLQKVNQWRGKETKIDFGYNLADGIMEIITQFVAVFTIFILYVIEERHDDLNITFRQIFEVAVLFSVFKTPFKMVGYGMASLLEAYAGIQRLQHMFDECQYTAEDANFNRLQFPRLYNQNPWLQRTMMVEQQTMVNQIKLKSRLILPVDQGIMTMVLGKIDSKPSCETFMDEIEEKIRLNERTIAKIDYSPFLIQGTIRQNIIFYHEYDEKAYLQVLQVTHLSALIKVFPQGDATNIEYNHFETLFQGLSLKIELARAIYTNCQFLLINRLIFKQYQEVMGNIRNYRNQRNQTTVVVNLSGSYYNVADQIITLSKGHPTKGSYQTMKNNSILQEFQAEYIKNSQNKMNTNNQMVPLMDIQKQNPKKIQLYPHHFLRFYGLIHWCVGPLVMLLLLAPPLLDLYFQVIVAQTFQLQQHFHESHGEDAQFDLYHEEGYSIVLRSGMTFLAFVIAETLKVVFLSLFIRLAAYKIFVKMMKKFFQTSLQSSLSLSLNNRSLDFERNIEHIDTKFTSDMDLGITIFFQQITAVLFGSISSALFLVIGIPFLILILFGLYLMGRINKLLFQARLPHITNLNAFYFKLLYHKEDFTGFKIEDSLFKHFGQYLKKEVIFESNHEWLVEALGIILEILFMAMLAVSMIISLVRFDLLAGDAFIELSISFLIGLTNTSRIQLKMMEIINTNLIGISNIFLLLDQPSPKTSDFTDAIINQIEYKRFGTTFEQNKARDVTFKIQRGQRIAVVGSKRSGKRITFLNLIKIIQDSDVQGSILFNGKDIYENVYSRKSLANYVYFLQKNPMILDSNASVGEQLSSQCQITSQEIQQKLNEIWASMGMEGQFDVDTKIKSLTLANKQIYNLLRVFIIEPSVLVIDGGMGHIDSINRGKLTRWIIKQKKAFGIVIDLSNRVEVIKLYERVMIFKDGFKQSDEWKASGTIPESIRPEQIASQLVQEFIHPHSK